MFMEIFEPIKWILAFLLGILILYIVIRVFFKAIFLSYFEAKSKLIKKQSTKDEEVN